MHCRRARLEPCLTLFSKLYCVRWRSGVNSGPKTSRVDTQSGNSHNWENWENCHERSALTLISRGVLTTLVTAACVLPVTIAVVLGVGRLLGAMEDASAAAALDRIALGTGILRAIDLVCLLLAQGINAIGPPGPRDRD